MHFPLHRFLVPQKSNSKTPTAPKPDPFPFPFSSLRSRLLTHFQKKKQSSQLPKSVHWGSITIIQDKPEPESESKSKPYNHSHTDKYTSSSYTNHPARKPILKPATSLDIITSQASLWALIHETESRIGLNYEYLSINGDAALDAWLRKEEEAMFRRANTVARANLSKLGESKSESESAIEKNDEEEWEFVADVGAGTGTGTGSKSRAGKPRHLRRRLRVSVMRVPVPRVNS